MLTQAEMTDARDKLRAASNLIEGVRGVFISAGYIQSARFLTFFRMRLGAPQGLCAKQR